MLPAEPRPADGRAWTSRPSVSAVLAAGWPPNSRCRPPPPLAVIGIAERAIKGLVLGLLVVLVGTAAAVQLYSCNGELYYY
jgi:hypothetical protein